MEAAQLVPPRQLGQLLAKREACILNCNRQTLGKVAALEDRCAQLKASRRNRYAKGLRDGYEQCLYDLPRPVRFYVMIVCYPSKVEASLDSLLDQLWCRFKAPHLSIHREHLWHLVQRWKKRIRDR